MAIDELFERYAKNIKEHHDTLESILKPALIDTIRDVIRGDMKDKLKEVLGEAALKNPVEFYKALKDNNYLIDHPDLLSDIALQIFKRSVETVASLDIEIVEPLKYSWEIYKNEKDPSKKESAFNHVVNQMRNIFGISLQQLEHFLMQEGLKPNIDLSLSETMIEQGKKYSQEHYSLGLYANVASQKDEIDNYLLDLHKDIGSKYGTDIFLNTKEKGSFYSKTNLLLGYHLNIKPLPDHMKKDALNTLTRYIT